MSFEAIPREIVELVLLCLQNARDKLVLGATCKKLNGIAKKSAVWPLDEKEGAIMEGILSCPMKKYHQASLLRVGRELQGLGSVLFTKDKTGYTQAPSSPRLIKVYGTARDLFETKEPGLFVKDGRAQAGVIFPLVAGHAFETRTLKTFAGSSARKGDALQVAYVKDRGFCTIGWYIGSGCMWEYAGIAGLSRKDAETLLLRAASCSSMLTPDVTSVRYCVMTRGEEPLAAASVCFDLDWKRMATSYSIHAHYVESFALISGMQNMLQEVQRWQIPTLVANTAIFFREHGLTTHYPDFTEILSNVEKAVAFLSEASKRASEMLKQ